MTEVNDNVELQRYSSAVLHILSAITTPPTYIEPIMGHFIDAVQYSTVRFLNGLFQNPSAHRSASRGVYVSMPYHR